ncbi:GNAT family N-acetyltransferase [Ramlibacter tataouinensis]|uniref:N-acetyltransferase domain-containing protein n=1 Tax=Ramlibacter tataouinensis (strain ATCC BAA-407 / DSM 14655 / LMG 21543 / TTB310) TaxID=365046 RepID=F5XY18_RAMTT|nr:GNAT family N-acetyltransferase [Ramlibacter tataouinensis]AEG94343.1 conserved hypothetical protein [Ramlibacter tataouinensis TTB310]
MANELAVRQATIHDVPALVPLFDGYRRFYKRPSDPAGAHAFLLERFQHAQSVIFLAFDNEQALGFTQLYPSFSSAAMARIYILNDLFVREESRGIGIGKALMQAAAEFARAAGAVRLTLSTAVTNTHAQGVYESLGWNRDQQFYVYNLAL